MTTVSPLSPDRAEIRRAIEALHAPDAVIELRALHQKGRKRTDAGYFDAEHREELIEAAAKLNERGAAVYAVMNPLDPQLLARHANRVQEYASATATDSNVSGRRWLLVDIDPQRPKDTSATDAQLEASKACARKVYAHLRGREWPAPVIAESGNGMHLLYRIDLPNDEASRDLVKHCLEVLAASFDDDAVKIDRSVFNSARIIKIHGTVATKGDNLPSAPWRLSRLRDVPAPIGTVSLEQLQALAAEAAPANPAKLNAHAHAGNGRAWTEADVAAFLVRGGIETLGEPAQHDGASRWRLKRCPFNPEHGPTESAVFLAADGRLGFKCQHNSCADRHWTDLRELVDGPRESRHSSASSTRTSTSATRPDQIAPPAVILRRASDIEMRPVSWLWSGWLAAGKLHMLGGVPGTGKTTIALSLAAVLTAGGKWPDGTPSFKRGNVVMWSGEDNADDTLVPRLAAAGADRSRVQIVSAISLDGVRRPFDPALDMDALIEAAREVGDVRLLIVDPVVMTVAGDSHKNAEVRRGLAPLVAFAEELDAAVLGITHFSKGTAGKDPLDRLTGSLAFGAAPRLVFAAAKQIADDGTEQGRLLVRVKSNLGPDGGGIGYQLATSEIQPALVASRIVWGERIEGAARDILAEAERLDEENGEGRSARAEAEDFLREVLADGPVAARDIFKQADDAGIARATLRRAKDVLGVTARKAAFGGGWRWDLVPKMLNGAEDAHPKVVSTFEGDEHLRTPPADREEF